jgi:hypothetical protein
MSPGYYTAWQKRLDQLIERCSVDPARSYGSEALKLLPEFKMDQFVAKQSFKRAIDDAHLIRGLQEAGLS